MQKNLGFLSLFVGIPMMLYAVLASGAAPGSDVLNMGLLAQKIILSVIGSSMFASGCFLISTAKPGPVKQPPPVEKGSAFDQV